MSRPSERYDHVISDEFDDYESRRRCGVCRRGRERSPTRRHRRTTAGRTSSTNAAAATTARILLFALAAAVVLAVGIACSYYLLRASHRPEEPTTAVPPGDGPEKSPPSPRSDRPPRHKCCWPCVYFRRKRHD